VDIDIGGSLLLGVRTGAVEKPPPSRVHSRREEGSLPRITKHKARQSKIMLSVQIVKAKCRLRDTAIEKNGDYPKTPMEMGVFTYSASG
jgi:hypothetical protein